MKMKMINKNENENDNDIKQYNNGGYQDNFILFFFMRDILNVKNTSKSI